MANKKKLINLAKELDFETEYDYYNYIIDSSINGQPQQVKQLYNDMSRKDRDYFINIYLNDEVTSSIKKRILDNLKLEIC